VEERERAKEREREGRESGKEPFAVAATASTVGRRRLSGEEAASAPLLESFVQLHLAPILIAEKSVKHAQ